MKKVLLMGVLASFMLAGCGTAKSPEMKRLEKQQQALKLNTELNELQMKLTQEQPNNQLLQTEATQANEEAINRTDAFSDANSASASAEKANKARKALRKASKANRNLAKSNRRIEKLQKDITKLQEKITKLNAEVEFSK